MIRPLIVGLAIALPLPAVGQTLPATRVASTLPASSTQPAGRLWQLVAGLNDRDAAVRDRSAEALMGLTADDLPALRQCVADAQPIFPAQTALLHDIVSQIVQSSLAYEVDPSHLPCLGIEFCDPEGFDTLDMPVRVFSRFPGFSTYRALRDGDIIVALADRPDVLLTHGNFKLVVQTLRVGQTVGLIITRSGKTMTVDCVLRARPSGMGELSFEFDNWIKPRQAAAEEYWQSHFEPLMSNTAS